MARFGPKRQRSFRASTRVLAGKAGTRIGLITPGLKRMKRRTSGQKIRSTVPIK